MADKEYLMEELRKTRHISTSSYGHSRSTKLLHIILERFESGRETRVNFDHKFSKGKLKLSNGSWIENAEYLETWYSVTVYLKPFKILGRTFKLKYSYDIDFRRHMPLGEGVYPKELSRVRVSSGQNKYHIKNTEVTKEEYEAYIKSKGELNE